jgi:hypothetical protein
MTLMAWTKPEGSYPEYFNATREGDDFVITVRAAPTRRDGVYVCSHARDAGPGRCVAGGPTCNNYCNLAPEKGPMQRAPLPFAHVTEGATVRIRIPFAEFSKMFGAADVLAVEPTA